MLQSFIRGAFTVFKDHEIIVVDLISHDVHPRLFDNINNVIFKRQIKAGWREAEDMRRVDLDSRLCAISSEPTELGIPHRPQHDGVRTFCFDEPVDSPLKEFLAL